MKGGTWELVTSWCSADHALWRIADYVLPSATSRSYLTSPLVSGFFFPHALF